jgi:nuclear pore complex protein Nup93
MNEWKMEKIKLMNALIGPSQNWIDFRKGPEQTILNETAQGAVKSSLNSIQMAYAREVTEYNRYDKAMRPSLVEKFTGVAQVFNDKKILEMWEIIKFMSNVRPIPKNQDPIKHRFQSEFVDQAMKYLEKQYKIFMQTVISEHLRESQRGGDPSNYKLVESFVALRFRNPNDLIGLQDRREENGKTVWPWPMAYFCMRCGDNKSALKCLEASVPDHKEIIAALEEILKNPDGKVSARVKSQIKMQYKQHKIRMSDPYKRAVFSLLGSCNETHQELTQSSDDYLWIQLYFISNVSTDASDKLTLPALQTMILEQYGEKHFNANEQPHLYFQILVLTGQFEAGIEFLSRFERFRTHAVHFALALNELHLLTGPRNVQEPLLSVDIEDPKPVRRLNIARLVMLYVNKFEISDPSEALQYYYFLRHLVDSDGKNLFLSCVADLVTENLNYELIFGRMQLNGMRSRGLIDQFDGVINVQSACNSIADGLVKKGLFEDAIKMYDLAGNQEQTLRYIVTMLSQVVHQPSKPGSMKERLQQLTVEISERYRSMEINCDPQILKTFNVFKSLMAFFECYHDNKHEEALEILGQTKLVPLSMNDLDVCVQNFKK